MIVMKFGGTSVGSADQIRTIHQLVSSKRAEEPIVVVSAVSGTTNLLLEAFNADPLKVPSIINIIFDKHIRIVRDLWGDADSQQDVIHCIAHYTEQVRSLLRSKTRTKSLQDQVVSVGEILSSYIVARYLSDNTIDAVQIIASEIIHTNNNFGSAEFIEETTKKKITTVLLPLIQSSKVPVVTGFIGATDKNEVTTLGRGGSDYSAAIIGYCLGVKEVQIWTDVDGMYTTDPRVVKEAEVLSEVSFREASELATFGAKVLHPKTIKPAIKASIPVRIRNTFRIDAPGTLISEEIHTDFPITAIAFKRSVTLINIYSTEMLLQKGFLAEVFRIFSAHSISIDLVSVSEVSVSVTLDNDDNVQSAVDELSSFTSVKVMRDFGIVTLVGENVTESPSIVRSIFEVLETIGISVKMISLGASDINISLVVPYTSIEHVVATLHSNVLLHHKKLKGAL